MECTFALRPFAGFKRCVEAPPPPPQQAGMLEDSILVFLMLMVVVCWWARGIRNVLAYFALGAAAYKVLEGWDVADSVYFMTVTSTTVGFGDIAPVTASGRLFTCVYAWLGTTFLMEAASPYVEKILNLLGALLAPLVPEKLDISDRKLKLKEVNASIS